MTRARTEDDLLEFKRLVRWLAGVTLTQVDAEKELAALEARYGEPEGVLVTLRDEGPTASPPYPQEITLYMDAGVIKYAAIPPEDSKADIIAYRAVVQ